MTNKILRMRIIAVLALLALAIAAVTATDAVRSSLALNPNSLDTVSTTRSGLAPEAMMTDRAMMKSASMESLSAGRASLSSAPQHTGRRIEQSHNFRYRVERELVADQYERAFSACSPSACEVVNGTLDVQGVTKSATLTVRIDPDEFNAYMEVVGDEKTGVTLVNHSRSAVDRTREYEDIDARLLSQKRLRDRLEAMVDSYQGQNIRSLLEIERELARVQGSIESMEAQLRNISSRTDRITASISFFSSQLAISPERPPYLKNALKEVGSIFEGSLAKLVLFVAAALPYILGLIILLALWKVTSLFRRNK